MAKSSGVFDPKKIADAFNKSLEETLKLQEKIKDIENSSLSLLEKELKILQLRNEHDKKHLKDLEIEQKQVEKQLELLEEQKNKFSEIGKLDVENYNKTVEKIKLASDYNNQLQLQLVKYKEQVEEQLKLERSIAAQLKQTNELYSVADKLSKLMGSFENNKFEKSFLGVLAKGKKEAGMSVPEQLKVITGRMKENILSANGLTTALERIFSSTKDLVVEQQAALSEFQKTTGVGNAYDKMIIDIAQSHRSLGFDTVKVSQALNALRSNYSNFNNETQQTQKNMTELVASFQAFNISAETTSKSLDVLTKGMGLTVEQSIIAQKEMFATARALGIAPQKMAQDFLSAAPKVAAFGKEGHKVFKELAVGARATGMEVGNLLNLIGKFEQFDTAADAVGQLNAVLGSNFFDSMQLTEKALQNPMEALKDIQKGLKDSGKDFDSMSVAMRKSLANILNVDVSELSRLMKANLQKEAAAAKEAAISQEKLNELMRQAQPIMAKIKNAVMSFAVSLNPLINILGDFINLIAVINDKTGGVLVPIIFGLIGGLLLLTKVVATTKAVKSALITTTTFLGLVKTKEAAQTTALTAAEGANAAATRVSNEAKKEAGKISKSAAIGMIAFGAAVLLVGVGVFLLTSGIAKLAEALKGITGKEFAMLAGILGMIAIGIAAIGFASGAAAIPTLAFGAAVLLIGAGIGLIFYSISLMIKSLTELFNTMSKSIETMPLLIGYLSLLSTVIFELGMSAGMAGITLPGLMLSLYMLSMVLSTVGSKSISTIEAFSTMFTAMSKISDGVANSLIKVAQGITEIVAAIDKLPTEKSFQFSSILRSVVEVPTAEAINVRTTMATMATTTTVAASGNGGSQGSTLRPIILEIDGRVLDKKIIDIVNDHLNPRRI